MFVGMYSENVRRRRKQRLQKNEGGQDELQRKSASKDLPQQVTCDVFDIEIDNENCHSSHLVKKSKIHEDTPLTEMNTMRWRWVEYNSVTRYSISLS